MSMAITVATAGVGALFARGKEASKYAFKAFGNANKSLVKQSAQLTGKSVNKVMTKQVLKKISKKVAGAVADAGISLATDVMVSQMSGAINSMSECIIECIDTLCQNENLKRKMSEYLQQQNLLTASKYLHQITMRALQRQTFLELWDAIEDGAKTGLDVFTQAHARAGSHLKMRGSSLKGKTVMKGISYVSRFAPLATETVKAGLVSAKMVKVKNALMEDLERATDSDQKQGKIQSDKSREKQIQEMVDEELSAIKRHLRDEMSQRSQKVVKMGLQMVGQEMKNKLIKVGKEHVLFPLKEHMDLNQLKHCEQKLTSAKLDENCSKIKKYEIKLQKLMRRTRSPAVFAQMIKHHDALLGPAFALPALEMLVTRPIQIVTETKDGKLEPLLNVAHHAEGSVLQIKFVPGKDGSPGHYYFGDQKFTPQQHGNNCLIQAVLTGAGKSHMDPGEVRTHIAQACREPKHPCHHYIKSGVARNYVTIGLVGGAVKHKRGKFSGKAEWYPHMDVFLQKEWYSHPENAQKSGKNLHDWKRLGGEQTLIDLGLHRCHMVSEKSIHQMLEHAMNRNNINLATVNKIIDALLPPIEKIRDGSSAFGEGNSQRAFLETCDNRECRAAYEDQRREARQFVNKLAAGRATNEDKIELAINLNNSPANVSFGHARNNMSTSKFLDYNPASPRSIYLYNELHEIQGFIPQKEGFENRPSSFFTDPRRQ